MVHVPTRPAATPQLELEQRPELLAVVGSAPAMIVEEAARDGDVELAADPGVVGKDEVPEAVPELRPEPGPERQVEALLGSIHDLGRQEWLGQASQQRLPAAEP